MLANADCNCITYKKGLQLTYMLTRMNHVRLESENKHVLTDQRYLLYHFTSQTIRPSHQNMFSEWSISRAHFGRGLHSSHQ